MLKSLRIEVVAQKRLQESLARGTQLSLKRVTARLRQIESTMAVGDRRIVCGDAFSTPSGLQIFSGGAFD